MDKLITDLQTAGFLESKTENGDEFFCLTTPCTFRIESQVVSSLIATYPKEQEIGGVFWAKPLWENNQIIYQIDKVTYIRNAIENQPRMDKRNKSNAYLPDLMELNNELISIFGQGYLPVRFHTHPIKGENLLETLKNVDVHSETSEQDRHVSDIPLIVGTKKLLMPRALIVGNEITRNEIFVGIYNGFIAPKSFNKIKLKVQQEKVRKTVDRLSTNNFTDNQKFGLFAVLALLILIIVRYHKYSVPTILGLVAILPALTTNTEDIEFPNYYNRLSSGKAEIYVPNLSTYDQD